MRDWTMQELFDGLFIVDVDYARAVAEEREHERARREAALG